MKSAPILTITFALLAAVAFPAAAASALQYDRAAVNAGETWRLLTCQWTHWSASHLTWDVAVFVALGVACERRGRAMTAAVLAAAAVGVPAGVHVCCPDVAMFRGLSGVDCALFGLLTTRVAADAWRSRRPLDVLLIGGVWTLFAAKTAVECVTGRPVFVADSGFDVVPLAHVVGLVIGSAWVVPHCARVMRRAVAAAVEEIAVS